jgi:hypothetical protein
MIIWFRDLLSEKIWTPKINVDIYKQLGVNCGRLWKALSYVAGQSGNAATVTAWTMHV